MCTVTVSFCPAILFGQNAIMSKGVICFLVKLEATDSLTLYKVMVEIDSVKVVCCLEQFAGISCTKFDYTTLLS